MRVCDDTDAVKDGNLRAKPSLEENALRKRTVVAASLLTAIIVLYWLFAIPQIADVAIPDSIASIERGRYLVDAGGCIGCHEGTEHPQSLSGGLALESEFGVYYVSNITPDNATGIGRWNGKDLLLALKHGRNRESSFYYPAFPYPSYAGMTDQDVLDIGAYLMSLPAVEFTAPSHELPFWLSRWTVAVWNKLAAMLQPRLPEEIDPQLARGAYLARNLGHCGECHTPRNTLGIPDLNREFAGAPLGDGDVEAIDAAALAKWTEEDFVFLLSLGLKPDGEFIGGEMEKVVEHNTSKLTRTDQQAIAAFFKRR
ncbi:MAG: c-type cytochrome [Pseudomonadales bacterium]